MVDKIPQGLQLCEQDRQAALQECYSQLKRWSIALPPVEPLVIDFGLGQFKEVGLFEFWIANEIQAGYCGKYMYLYDGQTCPLHYHKVKHETFFVVRGGLRVTLGDEELELTEGQTLPIEPGLQHAFTGVGPTLMLELSMPSIPKDNFFESAETMNWLATNLA